MCPLLITEIGFYSESVYHIDVVVVELVLRNQLALESWTVNPKSSLMIVLACVHHLTEHGSSWYFGSVKYRNKKNILFVYYVAINTVTHITILALFFYSQKDKMGTVHNQSGNLNISGN